MITSCTGICFVFPIEDSTRGYFPVIRVLVRGYTIDSQISEEKFIFRSKLSEKWELSALLFDLAFASMQ